MNRKDILDKASNLIMNDRAKQHGDIVVNHGNIARLWSAYLTNKTRVNIPISEQDVALMLSLFKIGRTQNGNHTDDNYIDGAAYLAIGGEIINIKLNGHAKEEINGTTPLVMNIKNSNKLIIITVKIHEHS